MKIDFIGIGAARSGTTWLYNALDQHPEICLSQPKEINYFNEIDRSKNLNGKGSTKNDNSSRPFSWYLRHFKHCSVDSVKGEFSVTYFFDTKVPALIKNSLPDIKLLLNLRNPIERIYSSYWQKKMYAKRETRTFEQAIKEDPFVIDTCFYFKYLSDYLQYFDRDQIHITLFEDIIDNPSSVIAATYNYLGLDNNIDLDLDSLYKNSSKISKLGFMTRVMRHVSSFMIMINQSRFLKFSQNLGLKQHLLNIYTKPYQYPAMNSETKVSLSNMIKDDLSKLEQLIEKDLSHWKYT